jgi:hypothetical protein
MEALLSLDAHAHLDPARTADEMAGSGAILAMPLSLDEAARVVGRREPYIAWGVGCHPRKQVAGVIRRWAVWRTGRADRACR